MDNEFTRNPPRPPSSDSSVQSPDKLTLRDQFAMAALTGLLAQTDKPVSAAEFARQAYVAADAMMEARAR